jgi:ribosomal protein L3 glutamine methyltransferase
METLHNQELVATILEDNVASELMTIQDFLRWTYSTFNRSDIYYGQGHDNAWDEQSFLRTVNFTSSPCNSVKIT